MSKPKPVEVVHKYDDSCDMEEIYVNGECIASGNSWDFSLDTGLLMDAFKAAGVKAKLKKVPYKYDDDGDGGVDDE